MSQLPWETFTLPLSKAGDRVGLSPQQVDSVVALLAEFLIAQREVYLPDSAPLTRAQKESLSPYYRPDLLENVRLRQLRGESLQNPSFYPAVKGMGIANLPDFSLLEAITFRNVIVFAAPISTTLLFHEMVHAEQFRQLGIRGFAKRYALGFLSSGTYEAIPLEIQAYGLGAQFATNPGRPFSVEEEVNNWIAEGKF